MKLGKSTKIRPSSDEPRLQYAALPWRRGARSEILLVSTRGTGRWIIPKGWPMKGRAAHDAAAREALEEAGVTGKIGKKKLGAFHYLKHSPSGDALPCKVLVFPLDVTRQRKSWPESKQRTTRWFSFEEAGEAVREPELRQLIADFGRRLEVRAKPRSKDEARLRLKGAAALGLKREKSAGLRTRVND